MAGSKEVFYLKIGSEADRVTVASILLRKRVFRPAREAEEGREKQRIPRQVLDRRGDGGRS